jgi:hypothetical protein
MSLTGSWLSFCKGISVANRSRQQAFRVPTLVGLCFTKEETKLKSIL